MIVEVMDLNFKTLNFRKQYDTARLKRAKAIYNNEEVKVKRVEKIDEENYEVYANVEGSYWQRDYEIRLTIHGNYVEKYSCTCEDFQKGYICKHILATTMEVIDAYNPSTQERKKLIQEQERKKQEERERIYLQHMEEERKRHEYEAKYYDALRAIRTFNSINDSHLTERILENNINLKSLYEQTKMEMQQENTYFPELATQIKLEPKIEIESYDKLCVTFKIGQNKMYILKDIEEFYNAFLKKKHFNMGKT